MTKKLTEILILTNIEEKPVVTFQYETGSELLATMTKTFRKWEHDGKISIVDIRPAQYHI